MKYSGRSRTDRILKPVEDAAACRCKRERRFNRIRSIEAVERVPRAVIFDAAARKKDTIVTGSRE